MNIVADMRDTATLKPHAKVRHLEGELKGLEEYKSHHPEDSHDPTPLEVFCDMNPEAPECLVYDD
jgi:hypothetical protein